MYPSIINYTVDLDITSFLGAIQGTVKSSCTNSRFELMPKQDISPNLFSYNRL